MASSLPIYKRKDRPWDLRYWIGYRTACGRWRREPVGESFRQAKEVLTRRRAEAIDGREHPERVANGRTFGYLLDRWWELHGQHTRSKSWTHIMREVRVFWGGRKASQVLPGDIQAHYNRVCERASPSTANRHLAFLRSVFNKTRRWREYHGENPCSFVEKKRDNAARLRFLTRAEAVRLVGVSAPRIRPVIIFALLTGMRCGEILGLEWRDVDLEHRRINVIRTKNGRPRVVPMLSGVRELLEELGPRDSGTVFDVPYITLRRHFLKALADANICDFRFHDLRHTFASHFIMQTKNLPALQAILGHSTPAMTQRYAHLAQDHVADAMDQFGAGFRFGAGTAMTPSHSSLLGFSEAVPSPQAARLAPDRAVV